jgi:hypothetical protein
MLRKVWVKMGRWNNNRWFHLGNFKKEASFIIVPRQYRLPLRSIFIIISKTALFEPQSSLEHSATFIY